VGSRVGLREFLQFWRVQYGEIGADALRKIRETLNLFDPYRKSLHLDVTVTRSSGDGKIGCRLDRFTFQIVLINVAERT